MPVRRSRCSVLRAICAAVVSVAIGVFGLPAPPSLASAAVAAGGAGATVASTLDVLAGPALVADLEVMTFNLRYASTNQPNSWAQRRSVMGALLATEQPDLIGTQEGLVAQLRDIETDLGASYDYIGVGREGGTQSEFMAIFYDTTRLTPQEHRHFWLSDTPEKVASNTWGGRSIRMVTWVRFLDRVTGGQFYAVNTHLDNASEFARQSAAALIWNRLAALTPKLPIVLTGDFNTAAEPASAVYDLLVNQAGYQDTWTTAQARNAAYGTFHDYLPPQAGGRRIDWILVTPGVTATASVINRYGSGAQFPSDHLPVQARLRLPPVLSRP